MPVCSGPIVQTAWVVEDVTAAERFLSEVAGVARWTRIPDVVFGPDCDYRGTPAEFMCNIALAYIGDMQLELIHPVKGESIYTEFVAVPAVGCTTSASTPTTWRPRPPRPNCRSYNAT